MIRSTPSSSGSGNITPASTRMAVSPQAIDHHVHAELAEPPSGIELERRRQSRESADLVLSQP